MLKQYETKVVCRFTGRQKTFYYTLVEEPGKPVSWGYRYGCNDRRGCKECFDCWIDVRQDSSINQPDKKP